MQDGLPEFLSLGGGVQSSTLALLAAHGVVTPMPKAAIFADTQDEPPSVYRWLDWLEKQLPFPVVRVTAGKLSERVLQMRIGASGLPFSKIDIPVFTLSALGKHGKVANRKCTAEFKIKPILREVRRVLGIQCARGNRVRCRQWIGISLDEVSRAKPSRDKWAESRFPLLELRWTRRACLVWMEQQGYPLPPRSACVYCPYHSDAEWRRLQAEEPTAFAAAVQFEKQLQASKSAANPESSVPFLHRSRKPLDQINFLTDVERGQQLLGFDEQDECEGGCFL